MYPMPEVSIKPDGPSGLGQNRFQNAFIHRRIERSVCVSVKIRKKGCCRTFVALTSTLISNAGPLKVPSEIILGKFDGYPDYFFRLILAVLIQIVQLTSKFRKFIRIIGNQIGKNRKKRGKKQILLKSFLEMNCKWFGSLFNHHPPPMDSCLS